MHDEIVRARVEAYGRVQGVFYRDTMRSAASELGITGSSVNRADGSVESIFEGSRGGVEEMIERAREGSRGAVVERLEVAWEDPEGLTGFATG